MTRARLIPALVAILLPTVFLACGPTPGPNKETPPTPAEGTTHAFVEDAQKKVAAMPAASSSGQPKIELQTTAFDMGVIPSAGIAEKKMKVYNRGTAPLMIEKVTTSCGCTTGQMDASVIAPGGEANLVIHVDPARIPGFSANKTLTVFNNDLANPHPTISVVSHVQPEVEIVPEVLDFGSVEVGTPVKVTARVRQLQDAPFELMGVTVQRNEQFIKASQALVPESEWKIKGKKEYVVTLDVLPTAPSGLYDEWIALTTNLTRSQQLPLKFRGTIIGPYDIAPRTVAVRGVKPGTAMSDVLTLSGKQDLKVVEVTNSNTAVQVTHHAGTKPNTESFGFVVPQRTPTPSLRDTWKIVFEVAGKRSEESVPVVIILAREN